jgi:uncharacterized membrane protein
MRAYIHAESHAVGVVSRIYRLFLPVPVVCFVGALATDIAYSASAFLMWLHFSEWLIAVGLVFGAIAAIVLIVELFASAAMRGATLGWVHAGLLVVALLIELCNSFVHTIDGWTAVVPTGMTLSVLAAIASLAAIATLPAVPVAWAVRREVHP